MKIDLSSSEMSLVLASFLGAQKEAARNEGLLSAEQSKRMSVEDDNRELRYQVEELRRQVSRLESSSPSFTDESFRRKLTPIFADVVAGRKIQAIKALREMTHCGLKEAKDCVEGNFTEAYKAPYYG